MDDKLRKQEEKRLKEGWIKATMIIEVLAVTEEAAKSALEKHVEKISQEEKTLVLEKRFHDSVEVEKPFRNIEKAYSILADVDFMTRDLDQMVKIVVSYAPSSIEILEPEKLKLDMGEAQGILNSMAELIHKFVQSGIGGVMISS